MHALNVIELFAGAAGLAQGLVRSKFYQLAALYDISEAAQRSYLNFDPHAIYRVCDVRTLEAKNVLDDLGGKPLHGIIGGPPCQGFSLAGKRLTGAEINALVLAYAQVVKQLQPCFLLMENVPQLLYHPLFTPLLKELSSNYSISYAILNAARYGTPQTRHRLFLVAYRKEYGVKPTFPGPTHGHLGQLLYAYSLESTGDRIAFEPQTAQAILGADPVISREIGHQVAVVSNEISQDMRPFVTVGDAISDVGNTVEGSEQHVFYSSEHMSTYQSILRNPDGLVANCVARKHVGKPLQIALTLREGGTPQSDGSSRNKRYYSQAYGRLHRHALARTLTTYFQNAGSGRFLHYEKPRTLTVREAARLQGFPDRFVFIGNLEEQMQLVGNAVPLPLAEAVGRHVALELGQHLPV